MRYLYFGMRVTKNNATVLKQSRPGRAGVLKFDGQALISEGVKTVQISHLKSREDLHLYILMISWTKKIPEGLYRDADVDRLTWVCIPRDKIPSAATMAFSVAQMNSLEPISCFMDQYSNRVKAAPIPLGFVSSGCPQFARFFQDQLMTNKRVVPAMVRHESCYDAGGNNVEKWGRPGSNQMKTDLMHSNSSVISHTFLSPSQKRNYFNLFVSPIYKPSYQKRIDDRCAVIANAADLESIDDAVGALDYKRGRSVGSFSRPDKGVPETLMIMNRLLVVGRIDRAVVTWQVPDTLEDHLADHTEGFDFTPSCDRKTFLRKAATVSAAIFNSHYEGSPVAIMEAAYCGTSVLYPDAEWSRDIPDGLPFKYRSTDEIPGMLKVIFSDPEKWGRLHREYVKLNYGPELSERYVSRCVDMAKKSSRIASMSNDEFLAWKNRSKFMDNLGAFLSGKKKADLLEIFNKVGLPRDMYGVPSISHHDLPFILERGFGWIDDVTKSEPCFVMA